MRGVNAALHYVQTKDGKAQFLLETKLSDSSISKNLHYFCNQYDIPGIQLVRNLKRERQEGSPTSIEVRSADTWLAGLE